MDPENGTLTEETPQESPQESPSLESSQDSTPEVKAPVSEALAAFDRELGRAPKVEAKPEAKTEPKADETPAEESPSTEVAKPRNFEGLDPNEVAYFKRMSNSSYEALYPRLIQAKKDAQELQTLRNQVKELEGKNFYTHADAYRVMPEYSELSNASNQLDAELNHWQEQLALAKQGQPITPLVRNSEGKVVYGEPRESLPDDEAKILSIITRGHVMKSQLQDKLSNFENGFKSQHGQYVTAMQGVRSKIFQGVDLEKLSKAGETKRSMFPAYMRGAPEVQILCELMVINEGLIKMLEAQKAQTITQTAKARTAANNGPKVTSGAADGKGSTVGDALEDFKKAGLIRR